MVIIMLKKLFKVVIPIFLSIICGGICGKLMFSSYATKLTKDLKREKIYLIQAGAYSNYDNMINNTLLSNYIYYQDEGLYKSIIGVTLDKDNIEKIKSTYDGDVIVTEYYSNNDKINKQLKERDNNLKNITTKEEIKETVLKTLELYKDIDTTIIKVIS